MSAITSEVEVRRSISGSLSPSSDPSPKSSSPPATRPASSTGDAAVPQTTARRWAAWLSGSRVPTATADDADLRNPSPHADASALDGAQKTHERRGSVRALFGFGKRTAISSAQGAVDQQGKLNGATFFDGPNKADTGISPAPVDSLAHLPPAQGHHTGGQATPVHDEAPPKPVRCPSAGLYTLPKKCTLFVQSRYAAQAGLWCTSFPLQICWRA
jgi:hypothetical protein